MVAQQLAGIARMTRATKASTTHVEAEIEAEIEVSK